MRIWRSHKTGGPEALQLDELADPILGPGDVAISVRAIALNYPDTLLIRDLYQARPERPFAPGSECSGVVSDVGEGVTVLQVGDPVIGLAAFGMLAEHVVLPAHACIKIPEGSDMVEASGLLVTFATAYHALKDIAGLDRGSNLLILGAAGGVGQAAIQLGKFFGANVVAAVSTQEKANQAKNAGARHCIIYPPSLEGSAAREFTSRLKESVGPEGFDVIVDPVGGAYSEAAFRAVAWGGKHLVIGFPAGIGRLPLNLPLVKGASIHGVFYGEYARRFPEKATATNEELLRLHAKGLIQSVIGRTFAFEDAPAALSALERRETFGKVIISC